MARENSGMRSAWATRTSLRSVTAEAVAFVQDLSTELEISNRQQAAWHKDLQDHMLSMQAIMDNARI